MTSAITLIDFIVNFPFLDGDVSRSTSYGVYISQLFRFARVSCHVTDFNARNKILSGKLLHQGYRYHKLCKAFSTGTVSIRPFSWLKPIFFKLCKL